MQKKNSKKNFTNFIQIKNKKNIIFADKANNNNDSLFQDLEKLSFENGSVTLF